jgi:hypothetical protein
LFTKFCVTLFQDKLKYFHSQQGKKQDSSKVLEIQFSLVFSFRATRYALLCCTQIIEPSKSKLLPKKACRCDGMLSAFITGFSDNDTGYHRLRQLLIFGAQVYLNHNSKTFNMAHVSLNQFSLEWPRSQKVASVKVVPVGGRKFKVAPVDGRKIIIYI